jgi:enediyne biosynthesis protein E4
VDFDAERLIPKMLSTETPRLASGDVNGDGLEDFFMTSATGDTAKLFVQQSNGQFVQKPQQAFIADKYFENTSAVFFDADGDRDLDLALASGGNQAKPGSPYLAPRLYINDGAANFTKRAEAFGSISINASCIRLIDYNNDRNIDLFIGARSIPGSYGLSPASALLMNDGKGIFTDVTKTKAPELLNIGMVTDAQCVDVDGNGTTEIVLVGDWMPLTIFEQANGVFSKRIVPNTSGWWNCLKVDDIDNDGDLDLLAGNMGLNTRVKADTARPARLYVEDFDANGQTECIPVYYKTDGKAYPAPLKGELEMQLPYLKKKFLYFSEYAGKTIEEIFTPEQLKKSLVLEVDRSESSLFINDGKGNFSVTALPLMAQLSPVYGILVADLNGDGIKDIFTAGNFYSVKPQFGRFDASYGTTLMGDGKNNFRYVESSVSGLFVNGEARDIMKIGKSIIVAMNNAPLYVFNKNN